MSYTTRSGRRVRRVNYSDNPRSQGRAYPSRSRKGGKKNGKGSNIKFCMACRDALRTDHTGIICNNDHHICAECSKNFVNQVFEEPAKHIPLKCRLCKSEIILNTFERQLSTQQSQQFLLLNIDPKLNPKSILDKNEIIAYCPHCDYFEINTKDPGRLLFLCKKEDCCIASCFWCKKSIKNRKNKSKNETYDIDEKEVEKHFECAQLAPLKEKWDKALADGQVRGCPNCGVSGMKNNACTHMTCIKCQTQWCYVCGLGINDLDKQRGFAPMFGHNQNWKRNPKRCPLWLNEINEIDERWPEENKDEEENNQDEDVGDKCVAYLHRLRTMKLLKKVVNEIGDENFAILCNKYHVDKTCGFDMKEVLNGDHTLIKREIINSVHDNGDNENDEEEDEQQEADEDSDIEILHENDEELVDDEETEEDDEDENDSDFEILDENEEDEGQNEVDNFGEPQRKRRRI